VALGRGELATPTRPRVPTVPQTPQYAGQGEDAYKLLRNTSKVSFKCPIQPSLFYEGFEQGTVRGEGATIIQRYIETEKEYEDMEHKEREMRTEEDNSLNNEQE
jgi:hypothetical protein